MRGGGAADSPGDHGVGGVGAKDPRQCPAGTEPTPSLGADGPSGWVTDSSRPVGSTLGFPMGCPVWLPGGAGVTQGQGGKTRSSGIRQSY